MSSEFHHYTREEFLSEFFPDAGDKAAIAAGMEQLRAEQRAWRLAEMRRRLGVTQAEVAARMGRPSSTPSPARPNCGPWPPTSKPSAATWRSSPTSATSASPSPNPAPTQHDHHGTIRPWPTPPRLAACTRCPGRACRRRPGAGDPPAQVRVAEQERLLVPYLRAWSEWTDREIDAVTARIEDKTLHPMDLKKVLAGDVVAAIHGPHTAMAARQGFSAQFSRHIFAGIESLLLVDAAESGDEAVGAVLTRLLEFTSSLSAARRIARQNGLRVVVETSNGQESVILTEEDISRPLRDVIAAALTTTGQTAGTASTYLKAGRKVAQISGR